MLPIVLLLPLLALPLALFVCLAWGHYVTTFWKRNRMPFIPARPFVGNLMEVATFKKTLACHMQDMYNAPSARGQAAVGIQLFHKPALMVRDPELLRRVLVKDFASFADRYSLADHNTDPVGGRNLFFLPNREWRALRAKLTPFFTGAKLRQMFHLMADIGRTLDKVVSEQLNATGDDSNEKETVMGVRDRMARFTTDVVASCAFGVCANSLVDAASEFRRYGQAMFDFTYKRAIEITAIFFLPAVVPLFGFKLFTAESSDFLRKTINYVITERERSGVQRNDLIDTLIQLKDTMPTKEGGMTFEGDVLVAQAAIFFSAGFETSSSTMSFALFQLAKNPAIQDRLRDEIQRTLVECNGELSYDIIKNMEYLNMVLLETLRLYPILPFLDRKCTSDDGYDLLPFADYRLPKGMPIIVPVYAIQRDPQYFADPERFDPERFSATNRPLQVPFTFMPFGLGPHSCIGDRFGAIQSKVGLISFLRNHRVAPSERTPCSEAVSLARTSMFLQPDEELYLTVRRDPLFSQVTSH